jgi:hypothetical protein
MERRVGSRTRTDFKVVAKNGAFRSNCRGVEVSPTGIVLDRGRLVSQRDGGVLVDLELVLPERHQPLRALARPVWSYGTQQAFRFVRMSDVDRLNLAEHLDVLAHRNPSFARASSCA